MSLLKTPDEIAKLKQGGIILSKALQAAMKVCKAGATTVEVDAAAREAIEAAGGKPSFLGYRTGPDVPPFSSTLCISINDEVVHGPALPSRVIPDNSLVSLDIGCWYEGLATDMATTLVIGTVPERAQELVRDTRESLVRALTVVKAGGQISDIGAAIEDFLKPKKYGIVRDLVGHGVGHAVHEEPGIPHYREPRAPRVKIQEGMVLAIEPMVTLGDWRVYMKDDDWTIATDDGSLAAHFELTIAVTKDGYELVTPWPDQV